MNSELLQKAIALFKEIDRTFPSKEIEELVPELEAALSASPVTLTEELREAATRLLHEVELYRGECGYRLSPGSGKFAADIEMVANAMLSPAAQPSPLTV